MKCETLIRSRYEEVTRNGATLKEFVSLKNPEPCGENGREYEVRKREAAQRSKAKDDPQQSFMGVKTWKIKPGTAFVRQTFCDKHKKKAEREGNELKPC